MIERMEDLVLTGMGLPFTPFTIINGDKVVPLLDRIRENLPAEIQHAQRVLERRDEIVTEAQAKAGQILENAKHQSEFMLSESELLRAVHDEATRVRQQITTELDALRKKAYEEADAVRAAAYEEARTVREGSDAYAEQILGSLDQSLVEFQTVVRNGQKYLKRTRAEAARAMPPQLQQPLYSDAMQPLAPAACQTSATSFDQPWEPAPVADPKPTTSISQEAAKAAYAEDFLKQTTLTL